MLERGHYSLLLEENSALVEECTMGLLLQRYGPKKHGYDGKSTSATGTVLLASVGMWCKNHGLSLQISMHVWSKETLLLVLHGRQSSFSSLKVPSKRRKRRKDPILSREHIS